MSLTGLLGTRRPKEIIPFPLPTYAAAVLYCRSISYTVNSTVFRPQYGQLFICCQNVSPPFKRSLIFLPMNLRLPLLGWGGNHDIMHILFLWLADKNSRLLMDGRYTFRPFLFSFDVAVCCSLQSGHVVMWMEKSLLFGATWPKWTIKSKTPVSYDLN